MSCAENRGLNYRILLYVGSDVKCQHRPWSSHIVSQCWSPLPPTGACQVRGDGTFIWVMKAGVWVRFLCVILHSDCIKTDIRVEDDLNHWVQPIWIYNLQQNSVCRLFLYCDHSSIPATFEEPHFLATPVLYSGLRLHFCRGLPSHSVNPITVSWNHNNQSVMLTELTTGTN